MQGRVVKILDAWGPRGTSISETMRGHGRLMRLPRLASEISRGPLRGLISEGGPYRCLDAEESILGLLIGCQELDRTGPDKGS
jgi:hypothetical protein